MQYLCEVALLIMSTILWHVYKKYALVIWSKNCGIPTIGSPKLTASTLEFHPHVLRTKKHPIAGWAKTSSYTWALCDHQSFSRVFLSSKKLSGKCVTCGKHMWPSTFYVRMTSRLRMSMSRRYSIIFIFFNLRNKIIFYFFIKKYFIINFLIFLYVN
jgi:hypothetical protein